MNNALTTAAASHFVTCYAPSEGALYFVGFASRKLALAYADKFPKLNVDVVTAKALDRERAQNRKARGSRLTYTPLENLDDVKARADVRLAELDNLRASAGMPLAGHGNAVATEQYGELFVAPAQSNADVMTPAELDLRSQTAAANIAAGLDGLARKHAAAAGTTEGERVPTTPCSACGGLGYRRLNSEAYNAAGGIDEDCGACAGEGTVEREAVVPAQNGRPAGYELEVGDIIVDTLGAYGTEPLEVVRKSGTYATFQTGERARLDLLVDYSSRRFRFYTSAAVAEAAALATAIVDEELAAADARGFDYRAPRVTFDIVSSISQSKGPTRASRAYPNKYAVELYAERLGLLARVEARDRTRPADARLYSSWVLTDAGREYVSSTGQYRLELDEYAAQFAAYLAARPAISVQQLSEAAGFHRNTLERYLDGSRRLTAEARASLEPLATLYGFTFDRPLEFFVGDERRARRELGVGPGTSFVERLGQPTDAQ